MDIQMPEMDGIEATTQIRNWTQSKSESINRRISHIPIIAMTAHAMQGDRERCLEAGMNDYIAKPVSPLALAQALEKWLPKKDRTDTVEHQTRAIAGELHGRSPHVIFNRADLMARLLDDEELARTVITCFRDDIPHQIAMLKASLAAGDAPACRYYAHGIRGASANAGGERLMAAAAIIENAAHAGDLGIVTTCMADLEVQVASLIMEFDRKV